ncbi:DHA2 family efflux MFS transporter permease subunit [Amycolatopsis sp. NPDC058278]|uniref:DHA2 family efflux MFS transporter permease subunit n=1 Tax=Amycolatopsis sp. NPDC058278 TaxID=3346417 RepID=UPI0036DB2666
MTTPEKTAAPARLTDRAAATGSAVATLVTALLGFFVVTLDAVVVNIALPDIRTDLGGGIAGLQWVVDSYTLMFAAALLSAGSLADRIGAKRAFGLGIAVFTLASLACGLAPQLGVLVAFRFAQGLAAAVVMPSSMALIAQAYPDPVRRARAVAMWAMGGAVASSAGPLLGGVLTTVSWRWIFLINLPAGAVALLLLRRVARSDHHRVPFDAAGQLVGALAMAALVFGAIEAGQDGFGRPAVLAALGIAVVALAAFVLLEARVAHPMLPLELFRSRTVVAAVVIGFAFMIGYYGMPFVLSLVLQDRGLSALDTGVVFLPMMLAGLVLTPVVPRVIERTGARPVVVTGLALMTAGLAALALLPATAPTWVTAAVMVWVGLGGPTVIPPVIAVLLAAVPAHRAGTASGLLNTSRQLGGALAVAVFGALLAAPTGLAAGMRVSLLLAAAVAAAAAFTAVAGLRTRH